MSILIDVYDPSGNKLGEGPVYTCSSASVRRVLDGVGNWSAVVSGADARAKALLVNQNRVRIYVDHLGVRREIGRGIIGNADFSLSTGGLRRTVSGPDELAELRDITVGVNRAYDAQTVTQIATDLVGLVSGWSVSSSSAAPYSARFDAISPLRAVQKLVGDQGLHLRQVLSSKQLEIGSFGTDAGVVLLASDWITDEAYANNDIAFIKQLSLKRKSTDVYNRIIPIGAGQNIDAALTLEKSARSVAGGYAYDIQTRTGNDGRTEYYIEDTASIAAHGLREHYMSVKSISALANNDTSVARAADAVYDAAVAQLLREKDTQETYTVSVVKCTKTIRAGDIIRLIYEGEIKSEIGSDVVENIDAYFWVLSVTEQYSSAGVHLDLEISNVDHFQLTASQVIIGSLEEIRLQGIKVQPTASPYPFGPEQLIIDPSNPGTVQLPIQNHVYGIDAILMRVRTQPFTATAKAAASGGGSTETSEATPHNHIWMRRDDNPPGGSGSLEKFTVYNGSSTYWFEAETSTNAPDTFQTIDSGAHSHDIEFPDHDHDIDYGVYKDNVRPGNITILVNGVNVTPSPIGSTGSDLDQTIDITDEVLGKVGGFRAVHNVDFACTSGQGEILVNFECMIQSLPYKTNPS